MASRAGSAMSGVRPRVRRRADLHLRVVLRPARGRLRLRRDRAADQPREDRGRAALASGATPICCRPTRNPAVDLGAGFTPLVRADRLAAELGLGEVWIKNDTVNPTNSFKDRVVVGRAVEGARVRVQGRGVRVDRQPRQLGRRARRARRAAQLRVHPRRTSSRARSSPPRCTAATSSRSTATTTTSTGCAPSSPGTYPWAFVNVNVRPFYAEGSKTLAFETAEQLGWEAPDHVVVPIASGSLLTKIRKGFDELHKVGLLDEEPQVRVSGAQALGCSPVATAWLEAVRHDPAGEARHDRQVARDRQPGRRLLRARRGAPERRRPRRGHRRRDRRRHAAARAHRGDLRRDRRRRHDRDAASGSRPTASSGPTSASSSTSPATA